MRSAKSYRPCRATASTHLAGRVLIATDAVDDLTKPCSALRKISLAPVLPMLHAKATPHDEAITLSHLADFGLRCRHAQMINVILIKFAGNGTSSTISTMIVSGAFSSTASRLSSAPFRIPLEVKLDSKP